MCLPAAQKTYDGGTSGRDGWAGTRRGLGHGAGQGGDDEWGRGAQIDGHHGVDLRHPISGRQDTSAEG